MRKEDLQAFAGRERSLVAAEKARYWKAAHATDELASMRAAHAAFEHARDVKGFPPPDYARADLEHHIELNKLIDRASAALPLR